MTGLTTKQTEQLRELLELLKTAQDLILDNRGLNLEWGSYNPLYLGGGIEHMRGVIQAKVNECPVCGGDKDGHTHGTWREDTSA